MTSLLGDGLVQLSLEIEDSAKSSVLLEGLIEDQSVRHQNEVSCFERDRDSFLKQLTLEGEESQSKISLITDSLVQRKKDVESQIEELLKVKHETECTRKKNLDAVRRGIAQEKENAHLAYKNERSRREKEWFDGRVSEINKLTWKGIQPNVERLTRKHEDQCEEIRARVQYSKRKLELQCENEISDRIQAFQRSEEQSNACTSQRSDFAVMNEAMKGHALSLMKLKEKLLSEEEEMKDMHSLQLQTLSKDNGVALSKVRSLNDSNLGSIQQQNKAEKDEATMKLELALDSVKKDIHTSQLKWEESWNESSASRVEKRNKQNLDELLKFRKKEIDNLIRVSLDQAICCNSSENAKARLNASQEDNVATLHEKLSKQRAMNEAARAAIAKVAAAKTCLSGDIDEIKEAIRATKVERSELVRANDRKLRQVRDFSDKASRQLKESLAAISEKHDTLRAEIGCLNEKLGREVSHHKAAKHKQNREHEEKLDALERYATMRAKEIDGKMRHVDGLIREQSSYLSRSQQLLCTRYGE